MTPKEHLIESLRFLCLREGGHVVVADEIKANDQTIWQIINGTKLPSGAPRGVGPSLQEKLDLRYPGWAHLAAAPSPAAAPHAGDNEVLIVQYDISGGMDTRGKLLLEAEPPGIIKSWKVDREWLQLNVRSYTSLQNLCIVTGFGPSMRGMFNPGDPLLMDRGVTRVDHEGVYFFRVGDEGYIKILQRVPEFNGPGFILRVISKNEDFPPYDISPKNPHFHVIGKILTVWRSEQY
jgi:hypothetical protein